MQDYPLQEGQSYHFSREAGGEEFDAKVTWLGGSRAQVQDVAGVKHEIVVGEWGWIPLTGLPEKENA